MLYYEEVLAECPWCEKATIVAVSLVEYYIYNRYNFLYQRNLVHPISHGHPWALASYGAWVTPGETTWRLTNQVILGDPPKIYWVGDEGRELSTDESILNIRYNKEILRTFISE